MAGDDDTSASVRQPPATVRQLIEARAEETPGRTFLIAPESEVALSFGGLRDASARLECFLDARGIARGETVALMLGNGLQAMRLLLGIMYAGRVATPLNLLAQPSQLEYVVGHSDARLVFCAPEFRPRLAEACRALEREIAVIDVDVDAVELLRAEARARPPIARHDGARGAGGAAPGDAAPRDADGPGPADPAPDDDALLMYTSGTTGVPKGVLLSHRNVVAGGRNVTTAHALGTGDRVLAVLPLYHINGQIVTGVAPLVHGGSVVMPHRFAVSDFWELAERFGVTWLNVVPTIISYLLHAPAAAAREADRRRTHIRFCRSASAPLAPAQHRAFEARFGIGIVETMGLTETAAPVFSNPLDPAARKIGSPGRPVGVEARVVDPSTGVEQPVNTPGEILVRGECVTRGYYKAPAETAKAIDAQGWLHTGDLGRIDEDGFVFVTGRLKELIIKGGENIAPREIDEALLRHPAVLEAAAVGIPDEHYGQEILACVVLKPGMRCDEPALREHCVRELGPYKAPKCFRFLEELPKGPSGKVQRLRLIG